MQRQIPNFQSTSSITTVRKWMHLLWDLEPTHCPRHVSATRNPKKADKCVFHEEEVHLPAPFTFSGVHLLPSVRVPKRPTRRSIRRFFRHPSYRRLLFPTLGTQCLTPM
ncbi:uncharacterized protein LOC117288754 [Asterias rubens]|uniref:uncharacterized protein LOC117288754 n=1 Tax=Asterias rubens TaxID=7604 RepID=UPI0014550EA4|nr:uncharacterized protein LOC117288754 [Asterias rubens]